MPSTTQRAGALRLFIRLFVALGLAMISAPLLTSSASAVEDPNQVVVCKYSHTPEVGEIAQTVIIVNTSALDGTGFAGIFPFTFSDEHNSSIAVRFAEVGENTGSLDDPEVECPPFPGDPVCPEGTDNAGEVIPEGETEESFCNDPDPVCPEGTDNAGQVIPEGETVGSFCDEDDPVVPVDPTPPNPPAPPAPPEPTLPETGAGDYLGGLALLSGLVLAASAALFRRSRRIGVTTS